MNIKSIKGENYLQAEKTRNELKIKIWENPDAVLLQFTEVSENGRLKESTGKESFNIVFTHTMHCSSIESFIKTADPNKRMQNFQTALMRITEVNTS